MNPPDEVPHSSVNGQTRTVDQGAARPKPKPRKGSTIFELSEKSSPTKYIYIYMH